MTGARTSAIATIDFVCGRAAAAPLVTYESPCECHDNHGEHRWAVKSDPSTPPPDAGPIQPVTPSDIYGWAGPDVALTQSSERTGIENKWFALTGGVVAVKAEADGGRHIALADATGDKPGVVVCEVPARAPSGVRFTKEFLVGRGRDFLCTFNPRGN